MIMDLRKSKEYLLGVGLKMMGENYDETIAMGNMSCYRMNDVFLSWFLDLQDIYNSYLPDLIRCLDDAISKDEDFGNNHNYHLHRLYKYNALGRWALGEGNNRDLWKAVCGHIKEASYTGSVWQKKQMATAYLDDYLAFCFLAGEYEEGKQEFQKYHGDKQVSLKKGTPKEFAYALCLRALGEGFEDEDFLKAGRRVLSNNLTRNWFGRGQIGQSVLWLNIVHWEVARSASPLEAVLKAYDDMPTLVKPA